MPDDLFNQQPSRRRFLTLCGQAALISLLPAPLLAASRQEVSRLSLLNTHTGERLTCAYREGGQLLPDALAAIDRILRDHRTDEVKAIDPRLLDLVSRFGRQLDVRDPLHVISGYRSPQTNAALRRQGHQVAKSSYHMHGKAIDLRVPGVSTRVVRDLALRERVGGVGHYPGPGFVHVDTGPVRQW